MRKLVLVMVGLLVCAGCQPFRASGGYTSERQGGTKLTRITIGSPLTLEVQTTVEPREGVVTDTEEGHFAFTRPEAADASVESGTR